MGLYLALEVTSKMKKGFFLWIVLTTIAIAGCKSFNIAANKFYCDDTHPCAQGWHCNIKKHVCERGESAEDIEVNKDVLLDQEGGDERVGILDFGSNGEVGDQGPGLDRGNNEVDTKCVPNCNEKECGDDGCGGSCGTCADKLSCENGKCVFKDTCGNGVCGELENCGNCPKDCQCPEGRVCVGDHCCRPGTNGCVPGRGTDTDGDGVPDDVEKDICGRCGDYAVVHSEVFPEGYQITQKLLSHHPTPEPCCPLSLKNTDGTIPCQCDWDCDGMVHWCKLNDADGDGYTKDKGDCDDSNPTVHPNAPEKCDDGIDQNCDHKDPKCNPALDKDKDGYDIFSDCDDNDPKVHPNAQEMCDGRDDNCNGYVDEGNPGGDDKGCHPWEGVVYKDGPTCKPGVQVCVHDKTGAHLKCFGYVGPTEEKCNKLDDDCDGKTDEDFDLNTDVNNCGACGHSCINPHGTTQCVNGKCKPQCDSGFGDCNNNPDDGCETQLDNNNQCGSCVSNKDCPEGFYCELNTGNCIRKKKNGAECKKNMECESNYCNSEKGVCCDKQCGGPCSDCVNGKCVAKSYGTTPQPENACNGYKCGTGGKCLKACNKNADCIAGNFCKDNNQGLGQCVEKLDVGEDCKGSGNDACKSGFCTDGVCCEKPCGGECERCDVPGHLGECLKVVNSNDDSCEPPFICDETGTCKGDKGAKCDSKNNCIKGLECKSDYVHLDMNYCASDAECVYDGKVYKDGEHAPSCGGIDKSKKLVCESGSWAEVSCGQWTCDGDCTLGKCQSTYRGCKFGECIQEVRDPDKSKNDCIVCMKNNLNWTGSKCCGDDGADEVYGDLVGQMCCYKGGVVASGKKADAGVLCHEGKLYQCMSSTLQCENCFKSDECTEYDGKICCAGEWIDGQTCSNCTN